MLSERKQGAEVNGGAKGESLDNAARTYKENAILTASGGQTVVLLYEKAVQNLEDAERILETRGFRGYDQVNNRITGTQGIITELAASLDKSAAPQLCERLLSLYLFFNRQLSEANFKKNKTQIGNVKEMLKELLDGWREANKTTGKSDPSPKGNATGRINLKG